MPAKSALFGKLSKADADDQHANKGPSPCPSAEPGPSPCPPAAAPGLSPWLRALKARIMQWWVLLVKSMSDRD